MNVIFPIYKRWNRMFFEDNILTTTPWAPGEKQHYTYRKDFEFKVRKPNIDVGDKIYIYEPKKDNGCGMVVGEFTIGAVMCLQEFRGGCIQFVPHFCRKVLKNNDYAEKFEQLVTIDIPDHQGTDKLKFALDEDSVEYIKNAKCLPPIEDYVSDRHRFVNVKKATDIFRLCDEWLKRIGLYNQYGYSNYQYAFAVTNPVKYETPKALEQFQDKNGDAILHAPQSFVYTTN